MAAQATIARPISTMHVGWLGIVLIAAAAFSAGIGLGASNWLAPRSGTDAVTNPLPAFNAPGFRLDEKLPLKVPAFDVSGFRVNEKLPLAQAAPAFDAAGFRLQEKLR